MISLKSFQICEDISVLGYRQLQLASENICYLSTNTMDVNNFLLSNKTLLGTLFIENEE